MSQVQGDRSDEAIVQKIVHALRSCYGRLDDPTFEKVSAKLASRPYKNLISALLASGLTITETTDPNDDVSIQLVASAGSDRVALELSAVGRFAVLRDLDADGRSRWVVRPDDAPTPLAALVANAVKGAGLKLVDRQTAMHRIRMQRADGSGEATLTDNDRVP
jgi:hypothetical protein